MRVQINWVWSELGDSYRTRLIAIISDVTREEGIAGNYGAWYVRTEKSKLLLLNAKNNDEMAIFVVRRASSYRYVYQWI